MLNGLLLVLATLAGVVLMRRLTAAAEIDREDEPRCDADDRDD